MGDGGESQRPRRIKRGRSMEGGEPRGRGRRFERKGERPSAEGGKQRGHTGERKREEVAGFTLGATSRLSLARRGTWKEGAHLASASASSRGWGKRVNSRRARPDHENGRR